MTPLLDASGVLLLRAATRTDAEAVNAFIAWRQSHALDDIDYSAYRAMPMLVEAVMGLRVETTFLFRIPDNRVFPVRVTEELRARVVEVVGAIRLMRELEEMPAATEVRARCVECEYANFCGDVW